MTSLLLLAGRIISIKLEIKQAIFSKFGFVFVNKLLATFKGTFKRVNMSRVMRKLFLDWVTRNCFQAPQTRVPQVISVKL